MKRYVMQTPMGDYALIDGNRVQMRGTLERCVMALRNGLSETYINGVLATVEDMESLNARMREGKIDAEYCEYCGNIYIETIG